MIHEIFSSPVSILLALAMCIGALLFESRWRGSRLFKILTGHVFSALLLVIALILLAMEGTWKFNLYRSPVFWIPVLLLIFSTGLYTIESIRLHKSRSFILMHLGFFIMMTAGFFSAGDSVTAVMKVTPLESSSFAIGSDGRTIALPFTLKLKDFETQYYEDGISPKQYVSTLEIDGSLTEKTSVNHPMYRRGWFIYQSDYDRTDGQYSILRLVRDPWLALVYLGMAILAAGALLEIKNTWQGKAILPVMSGLAVIFTLISIARINFGTLMPALRSLWFVPHLIIYMLAYSLMALSVILLVADVLRKQGFRRFDAWELAFRLLRTASALLILGMLCGAVWAKSAWGDYWTWDAKECWAAVTWLITLVAIHLPKSNKKIIIVGVILLAFGAMQITWYGVNSLPAAEYSMHTYNKRK